jgi:hypothetical protein
VSLECDSAAHFTFQERAWKPLTWGHLKLETFNRFLETIGSGAMCVKVLST